MHCGPVKINDSLKKQKLLSVCVVTYQHERFITDALKGILSQKTSFDFELLIFDDASSDKTGTIIKETCRILPTHISAKLFLQDKNLWNQQISGSCLILYPAVTSKYAAICEGDDYWTDPLKLQKQVDFLEAHPECAMCIHPGKVQFDQIPATQTDDIYPLRKNHALFSRKGYIPLKYMLRGNMATTASAMYRWKYYGDAFKEIYPQGICPGDWYLHLLHAKDGRIGYLPDIMSVYRKHSGGMYTSLEQNEAVFFRKYKEFELAFYDAVFHLYSGRAKETELWSETYRRYLNRMLDCFLATHDEESLIWFWDRFPDQFERILALNYFKSSPNSMLERLGRLLTRMGLKEEGFCKTIYRLLHKEPLP